MPRPRAHLRDLDRLYRVFPWLETATDQEVGNPLYIPTPQGWGRVDNPEHYLTLYVSDTPLGAIGEAFGNHAEWTRQLLAGPPSLPGSRRALVTYRAAGIVVLNLDDAEALHDRSIRPSRVVTRDRAVTQSWALGVHREDRWAGVRWWSYFKPEWGSFGIWDSTRLSVMEVVALEDRADLVSEVAMSLNRLWR
jgi:hypothetical protein